MHALWISTTLSPDGMAATETSARANEVLDELYRQHVGDVYRYTYAVLGNHADAEDVTQTTFVNALRALERGETPEEPSRWLTVIAHNLVRQRWRQAANRPALVELETDVPGAPEEEEEFELEELVRALQRIPETQREAIVMRELEGRSYREIATVLGLSTSALETLLFRARRSLADELENVVTCQTAEESISKRQDGRLSRKERRRLDEHLAECPDCARLAAAQQRQRRAFKGLALLPLPVGLALFKGAPSAAAATSVPTIGLGTATAGTSGTGAAGTTAAGATGGAAAGGSLAGGLAVKVAAVVVTATVATGVGYKGVQAVREKPAKPAPAHLEKKANANGAPAPARVSAAGTGHPNQGHKVQAKGKRRAASHGNPHASPGRTKHERPAPPGLMHEKPVAASGHAAGAAQGQPEDTTQAPGQAKPKHVTAPTPKPDRSKAPTGGNPSPGGKDRAAAQPGQTAPVTSQDPISGETSTADTGALTSAVTVEPAPTVQAPTTQTEPSTATPTPAPVQTPTTPPSTPPSGSTGDDPGSSDDGQAGHSNNGWDNGKKLGFYNENQDGKHLVGQ